MCNQERPKKGVLLLFASRGVSGVTCVTQCPSEAVQRTEHAFLLEVGGWRSFLSVVLRRPVRRHVFNVFPSSDLEFASLNLSPVVAFGRQWTSLSQGLGWRFV